MEIVYGNNLPVSAGELGARRQRIIEQMQQFLIPSFGLRHELVYKGGILCEQIQVTMPDLGAPPCFQDLGGEPPHLLLHNRSCRQHPKSIMQEKGSQFLEFAPQRDAGCRRLSRKCIGE